MVFSPTIRINKIIIKLIIVINLLVLILIFLTMEAAAFTPNSNDEIANYIKQIFQNRNRGILSGDMEAIESVYNTETKYGIWALEHEVRKMKYIHNWQDRQGVKFIEINPELVIRSIKSSGNRASVNLLCSTEYKYMYENQPGVINSFKIGTYHFLQLEIKDDLWIITKEWYKDPFADSLKIDSLKADAIRKFVISQNRKDLSSINSRRVKAVEYIAKYCGAAGDAKYGYKYNGKYRNFNSLGGDCANFASQVLFEGGKFRKTTAWNYDAGDTTRAWVNADGFKSYMIYSGRASIIDYGSYEKVYKAAYRLLPGDFVAYDKKGDITHISVVSGADSRGYSLVSCHNTDRNKVPWDLGWSDKDIKFWLVRVHY